MSDSVRPQRRQPIRLRCPWDSPGKNTGVGCHFLLQCMKVKVKSLSCVQLFATPWTAAHQAPPSMGFSRQEYWSRCAIAFTENSQFIQIQMRSLCCIWLLGFSSLLNLGGCPQPPSPSHHLLRKPGQGSCGASHIPHVSDSATSLVHTPPHTMNWKVTIQAKHLGQGERITV